MKVRWLILGGLAAFLWTLVIHAPIALLHSLRSKESTVQPIGLAGNIAEGRVAGISSAGHVVLRGLHWRWHPLWLLALRAAFDVEASEPAVVDGRVEFMPWGTGLSRVHLSGSLKSLLGAADVAYLPIDGLTDAQLSNVRLRKGIPVFAEGLVKVRGLVWSLMKPPLQLGDFEVTLTTAGDTITANIESPSGPLESHGEAHLDNSGSYSWDIELKPKPGIDSNTQNLLHSLGAPDRQGFYHIKNAGQWVGASQGSRSAP